MVRLGDRRREFLAKLLSDFAKLIVAAIVAAKIFQEVGWVIRLWAFVALAIFVILVLVIHPEGRN